jgi:hypothetical protein
MGEKSLFSKFCHHLGSPQLTASQFHRDSSPWGIHLAMFYELALFGLFDAGG